ncbi:MAG: hypothetical protein IJW28_03165, partial [Clostridia bacterium]|nr:hypothetical protein [Clostridia bacterium]
MIFAYFCIFYSKTGIFVAKYVNYTTPVGFSAYMLIIILFCFFYTFLQINPNELSKNLNKQGGYIP